MSQSPLFYLSGSMNSTFKYADVHTLYSMSEIPSNLHLRQAFITPEGLWRSGERGWGHQNMYLTHAYFGLPSSPYCPQRPSPLLPLEMSRYSQSWEVRLWYCQERTFWNWRNWLGSAMTQRLSRDWRRLNTGTWLKGLKKTHPRGGSIVYSNSDGLVPTITLAQSQACRIHKERGSCRGCSHHCDSNILAQGEIGCWSSGQPDWLTFATNTGIGLEDDMFIEAQNPKNKAIPPDIQNPKNKAIGNLFFGLYYGLRGIFHRKRRAGA